MRGERGIQRVRDGKRERERARERETVSSFTGWLSAKNILYWFVCGGNREYVSIPHEPDLPVGLSPHFMSVGFPVCLVSHLSV